MNIPKSSKSYKNVSVGKNATIGEFVIIGVPPRGKSAGELKTVIGDNAVIRSHSVIYAGNVIGDNFETGNGVNIRENNKIGNNVKIGTHSIMEHDIEIFDNVNIHSNVFICEYSKIEDGCFVGPSVCFLNAPHPLGKRIKEYLTGPTLKKKCKIGANSTLLPGVIIGEMSLVGAGSVVTKNIPAGKVVVGNPAKIKKSIKKLEGPFGNPYE
ncbi:MAG: acetyltransferase [uncultured bacterium]|uniref:2,3,4,5-tetrahydropyridine-2,6-dicarboxylate N-acetyltransferase n=3 Tax=Candidatus Daviesiibacteriota TaxID=1752718 RepID=A0A0G0FAR8_9BACT|nr:MAG: acetyltransferase [uncultured bacterium]KKQ10615.1 MAG: 2,3,4,5-tetrahydropyridine-2,6-dicarboxylate N-acetyltransferase [Candidatus Daviesbacteria bacterium GW2011_GWB1_36_5]KKQ15746.1 MAG: 2,3,4,5-tetrahydropyridine-2,6-dicarboxylate N-acetyltransferase [Candidatus Daviesbacteria bacterium GW2011_GWA1_36_8]OGE17837.1 MAG: transferase [Candidatus Daviesbacteria bacterium RIFCSPHIGHO2_01_FULL_36_37]